MNADQNLFQLVHGPAQAISPRTSDRRHDPNIEWISVNELGIGSQVTEAMVGRSRQLRAVFAAIERLRPYRSPVLVTGETGTGKELVAHALHVRGPYSKGPFVVFNCCNLVEALAESQLFGHVRGAFTDASQESQGCFRAANAGTLLLDEIGDLPLGLQGKLLRAVETYEIQPVGSAQHHRVDLRLVVATNRDLGAMVRAQQFRADLYYRLNTTAIELTPLRERATDIEALLAHFVRHFNRVLGKQVAYLSARALAALLRRSWPGNVRELAHVTENAVLMTQDDCIDLENLPTISAQDARERATIDPPDDSFAESSMPAARGTSALESSTLKSIVRDALVDTLRKTGGNRRRAAQTLGVSRSTFYRMMASHGVTPDTLGPSVSRARRPAGQQASTGVSEAPRP
ncbi:MAG: sigma-54 dependent transcriptional regulator [Candidatus Binataceae bacterium]|jgi:transcriptional regulator with GAF, ATPase, and Fis domain